MKFTAKSEAEIHAEAEKRGAWPPGVYDGEITTAVDAISKAGNDMITLTLSVFHPDDGSRKQMMDWLVAVMAFKLRHCCESAGLLAEYEAGGVDAWQLEGKSVRVKLGAEAYTNQDGRPATRNKVLDYVPAPVGAPVAAAPRRAPPPVAKANFAKGDDFDSDIPF